MDELWGSWSQPIFNCFKMYLMETSISNHVLMCMLFKYTALIVTAHPSHILSTFISTHSCNLVCPDRCYDAEFIR